VPACRVAMATSMSSICKRVCVVFVQQHLCEHILCIIFARVRICFWQPDWIFVRVMKHCRT
jgi:hypothetical protein